jgi:hypothetical protein
MIEFDDFQSKNNILNFKKISYLWMINSQHKKVFPIEQMQSDFSDKSLK